MPLSNYRGGHEGIFYYALETAPYPTSVTTAPAPALPSSFVWGGWVAIPEITTDEGTRAKYGIGSQEPQVLIPGDRNHTLSTTFSLGNTALLTYCFSGSGGFRDLADLCLITGASNVRADGIGRALRFAKCSGLTFNFQKGSAQEVTVQAEFWGLTEQSTTALTPDADDLAAQGNPLTWHNVMEINVNGINCRDFVDSITLGVSHSLERKNSRPDYGTSVWSRVPFAILPKSNTYTCELNFESPEVRNSVLGLVGSDTATGEFEIVVSDAGSTTEGADPVGFTLTAGASRLARETRRGGEDTNVELQSSVSLILSGVALS